MLEFLFFLYIVSGFLKGVLLAYDIHSPVDLTLLSGVLVIGYALFGRPGPNGTDWKGKLRNGLQDGKLPVILLGGFYFWCLFSAAFLTPSPSYVYWKCLAFLTNVLAFSVPLLDRRLCPHRLIKWLCSFALVYGLFAYFAYGLQRLDMLEVMGMDDPQLLRSLYLQAGLVLGVAGILALYIRNLLGAVLLNLLAFLIVGTAARGPILFFFFTLGLIALQALYIQYKERGLSIKKAFTPRRIRWITGFLVGNILLIALISSSEVFRAPYQRTIFRYNVLIQGLIGGSKEMEMMGGDDAIEAEKTKGRRLEEFSYVLDKVFTDPYRFTFGYGMGSFYFLKYGEDKRGYPHNVLLEIWFELGTIGLLLALGFMGYCVREGIRKRNYIFLFAILFFLMNTMKSYSIVDIRVMFALLGVAVFIPPSPPEGKKISGSYD